MRPTGTPIVVLCFFGMPRFRTALAVDNKGMSQQGERPATEDDWWNRLYDESAPDTGPAARAGDTLDDRFDSAADAVAADDPPKPPKLPEPPDPPEPPGPPEPAPEPGRPRAWWEMDAAARETPDRPTAPPRQRASWEPPTAPERPPALPPLPPPEPPRPDAAPAVQAQTGGARPHVAHVGDGPPTYDAEPTDRKSVV